jgi:hypothetical protein
MTIQPLLVHIKATIQSKFPDEWFLVKFYVDDGNFIAPSKIMREIIPFDKLGTLLGFIPSLEFIPERLVKRCRRAYTFVMEHLLNNKNNGEAALVWWKKF